MQKHLQENIKYGICGFGLFIVSCALFVFDPVEFFKTKEMKFSPGSILYDSWLKPATKININVYLFNITNADRFLAGEDEKLDFREIGPYVYSEFPEKTNCTFQNNDTITFIPRRKLLFEKSSTIGDPEKDRIIVPNVPLLGFSSMLTDYPMFANLALNSLVELQDSMPILNLTVKEFLWGYKDPLVDTASTFLPTWIDFSEFGLLDRMMNDGTNVITMAVPSKRQTRVPFTIDQFNGSPVLRQWAKNNDSSKKDKCSSLDGIFEGGMFPQHLTPDMTFSIYLKALCRTLPLTYTGVKETSDGYPEYMYTFLPEMFNSSLDDNRCYCPSDGCLPSGLSDLSPCYYGIPVAMSFPHFYGGDSSLLNSVNGMFPDAKKHKTVITIQPDIGSILSLDMKFQINVINKATKYITRAKKFNDLILPIFWLHYEIRGLPDLQKFLMYLCLNLGPRLVKAATALSAMAGLFLVGLSIRRCGQPKQLQHYWKGDGAGDFKLDGGDSDIESGKLVFKGDASSWHADDKSYTPLNRCNPRSATPT